MGATTPLNAVYCEGWDPRCRAIVGRLTAATARKRDREGDQYAVALFEPDTESVAVVLEIAWGRHFARCWQLDVHGRRHAMDEFRVLDGRLFLMRSEEWGYNDPQQPEFDEQGTRHMRVTYDPSGKILGGLSSGSYECGKQELYFDVPRFGEWVGVARLGDLDIELVQQPDPGGEEIVDPPWRPPEPTRPYLLDRIFRSGARWTREESDEVVTEVRDGGVLRLPTGRLVVLDPLTMDGGIPFTTTVPPGDYRVELAVSRLVDDPDLLEVAAVKLVISTEPVASWEMALTAGQDPLLLSDEEFYGFYVDYSMGGFVDADTRARAALWDVFKEERRHNRFKLPWDTSVVLTDPGSGATLVGFRSGNGVFPTWLGRTADGEVACFVADLLVLYAATPVGD